MAFWANLREIIFGMPRIVLRLHAYPESGGHPKYLASRRAVSAVTGVSLRASRSILVPGTPIARASSQMKHR
jgi:hypothetical protein